MTANFKLRLRLGSETTWQNIYYVRSVVRTHLIINAVGLHLPRVTCTVCRSRPAATGGDQRQLQRRRAAAAGARAPDHDPESDPDDHPDRKISQNPALIRRIRRIRIGSFDVHSETLWPVNVIVQRTKGKAQIYIIKFNKSLRQSDVMINLLRIVGSKGEIFKYDCEDWAGTCIIRELAGIGVNGRPRIVDKTSRFKHASLSIKKKIQAEFVLLTGALRNCRCWVYLYWVLGTTHGSYEDMRQGM